MKVILFDLEQTLIRDWSDPELLIKENPNLIPWINQEKPFIAGMLSMAVWYPFELEAFNSRQHLRPFIEETFGFKFSDSFIFLKDHILGLARKQLMMPFLEMDELDNFCKKKEYTELIWKACFTHPDTELVLLDDTVPNLTIINHDVQNCRLRLVDPWRIP